HVDFPPLRCAMYYTLFLLSPSPRTPSLPLFPYTTLFRSWPLAKKETLNRLMYIIERRGKRFQSLLKNLKRHYILISKSLKNKHQDRKSTRLNSSHVSISYAVFCLKKKNKIYNIQRLVTIR